MTLYPDVQRKAQAEIDQIVGNSRLPNFSDEGALPYVEAVLKETLRWHPVTPLGMFSYIAGVISPVDRITLQPSHTGSRRVTPTKGITFL
jgi:cytochrome P450